MTHEIDDTHWKDKLDALNAQVTKQGSTVRQLKKDGASADSIAEAVTALQKLKIEAESLHKEYSKEETFNRKAFDDLILRKMFVVPSFEIHGGVKGLYDLGPPACALKVCKHINKGIGPPKTIVTMNLICDHFYRRQ
jgi:glycyl-tRNA synthetase